MLHFRGRERKIPGPDSGSIPESQVPIVPIPMIPDNALEIVARECSPHKPRYWLSCSHLSVFRSEMAFFFNILPE
jgi:hypothetical protein